MCDSSTQQSPWYRLGYDQLQYLRGKFLRIGQQHRFRIQRGFQRTLRNHGHLPGLYYGCCVADCRSGRSIVKVSFIEKNNRNRKTIAIVFAVERKLAGLNIITVRLSIQVTMPTLMCALFGILHVYSASDTLYNNGFLYRVRDFIPKPFVTQVTRTVFEIIRKIRPKNGNRM